VIPVVGFGHTISTLWLATLTKVTFQSGLPKVSFGYAVRFHRTCAIGAMAFIR
jgi:hypothetical protein